MDSIEEDRVRYIAEDQEIAEMLSKTGELKVSTSAVKQSITVDTVYS